VVLLCGTNDPERGQPLPPAVAAGLAEAVVERPFADAAAMAGLLQHADLAISRSGAGALSELAVCGTPAILVPYPAAADGHQDANAAAAAALAAAVIVWQHPPGEPQLARTVWRLLGPRLRGAAPAADPLVTMRAGMERLAVRDATERLATLLQTVAQPMRDTALNRRRLRRRS
jgi:UDP-N-acetylglucosamine--N-acetylmuramyl-(pentapeptide) pyrophosphoryl-undecaprenol N-acetylglucosamine transferase